MPTTILTIPPELIEQTLIISCCDGHPKSIGALAQTCTHFRKLIYEPLDGRLWRDVLRQKFDDPRRVLAIASKDAQVNWMGEFIKTYKAGKVFEAWKVVGEDMFSALNDCILSSLPMRRTFPIFVLEDGTSAIIPLISHLVSSAIDTEVSLNMEFIQSLLHKHDALPKYFIDRLTEPHTDGLAPLQAYKLAFLTGLGHTVDEDRLTSARRIARLKVYNMKYLDKARCWGPFLNLKDRDSAETEMQEESSDSEYSPQRRTRRTRSATVQRYQVQKDGYNFFSPVTGELEPDYEFLLAARIVIEENLKEQTFDYTPGKKVCLDYLRSGGAPGFWRPRPDGWGEEDPEVENVNKIKEIDGVENVKGWDWAGVTGKWRRCVCWMDYHDLVLQNMMPGETYEEDTRVFPMQLRVVGYSAPSQPQHLPIIHIEGEAWGSDQDEDDLRYVFGTVRMIGEGAVRWSLTSSFPNERARPQWIMEGVQMGGIGSALGLLGIWTGAGHTASDPLGPTWSWKEDQELYKGVG